MAPPFIYINGYPAVGKFTVGKELVKSLPNAKFLDNHLLIDPVAAVYERSMPEYQGLRKLVRKDIPDSIANSESLKDVTWIFTDSQSSDKVGVAAVEDYINVARTRGSRLISIILTCSQTENIRRLGAESRGKTKLTDVNVLRWIRYKEDLYRFGGDAELEMDVTDLSAAAAAEKILNFVNTIST
ncbi:MAG: hypothetical protein Q9222_007335 [Ikaeria aurantiellina]